MVFKSKATLIFILILLLGLASGDFSLPAEKPVAVRVAIIQDAPVFDLIVRGPFEIFTLKTEEPLYKGRNLSRSKVSPVVTGLKIGNRDFKVDGMKIISATSGNIYVNGRRFRGEIQIIRQENLRILVINNLDLEEYIKGVLYHEVSHRWPLEALKAQAVAARTFAVYQTQINQGKDFDLTADIYSQVYGGRTSETYRTSVAVKRTRGEVLTYEGKILPAFYHATCGGHTEDAGALWNIDLPPLKGVECKFCGGSPHYKWRKQIPAQEVENKLIAAGWVIGGLEDIVILERDASDRVRKLKLVAAGNALEICGKDFRQILNPNIIRSANFTISQSDGKFKIEGLGWGHGVGMCQWGAYFMSLKGKKCEDILRYYYPGAVVKRLY